MSCLENVKVDTVTSNLPYTHMLHLQLAAMVGDGPTDDRMPVCSLQRDGHHDGRRCCDCSATQAPGYGILGLRHSRPLCQD